MKVLPNISIEPAAKLASKRDDYIVVAARFVHQKRLQDTLRVLERVHAANPAMRADIFGQGEDREELEKLRDELGLAGIVSINEYVPNPLEYLAKAQLTLMTSRHEGLPLALLENLSVGTPIVSYDIKYGPAYAIENGVNGYLVREGDISGMADRVIELLADKKKVTEMAQAALASAARFTAEKYQASWREIIEAPVPSHNGTHLRSKVGAHADNRSHAPIIVDRVQGVKVRFNTEYMTAEQAEIIKAGKYERKEIKAILNCLKGGERVLELGGGIGYVSTVVCKHRNPSSYDVVEASPRMIPVIKDTHELNGVGSARVHHCIATSDKDALERGYYEFNLGKNFLASSITNIRNTDGVAQVPTVSIAKFMEEQKPQVLIADIEGAEVGLLTDVDISCLDRIILEIHPKIVGPAGIKSIFDDMSKHGFTYDASTSIGVVVSFMRVN
nr:FkbM family methyltransferase [Rhizobium sp. ARZ01]